MKPDSAARRGDGGTLQASGNELLRVRVGPDGIFHAHAARCQQADGDDDGSDTSHRCWVARGARITSPRDGCVLEYLIEPGTAVLRAMPRSRTADLTRHSKQRGDHLSHPPRSIVRSLARDHGETTPKRPNTWWRSGRSGRSGRSDLSGLRARHAISHKLNARQTGRFWPRSRPPEVQCAVWHTIDLQQ